MASLLLAVVAILFGIAVAVVAVMASLVFAGFLLIGLDSALYLPVEWLSGLD